MPGISLTASSCSIIVSLDERGIFVISNVARTPYCWDFLVLNSKLPARFLVFPPGSFLSYIPLVAVFDGIIMFTTSETNFSWQSIFCDPFCFLHCTLTSSSHKEDDLSFVPQYLSKNGITDVTLDNFSFSTKLHIGEFLECKEVCDFNLKKNQ